MTMTRPALLTGLILLCGSAAAQTSPPPAAPLAPAKPGTAVIQPGNPDPDITVKPPQAGTTPVVPPPGTPQNNPLVVPK